MLSWLRVSGFALIDNVSLELPFRPGLTVITGETGAGKSILVDALALLRGGRARTESIRTGREEAEVEAIFDVKATWPPARRAAGRGAQPRRGPGGAADDRPLGPGPQPPGGQRRHRGELTASVGTLVDITSQHDQQSLMDPDSQLAILDAFAGNGELVERAREAFATLSEAQAALDGFEADSRARAEREDYLRFQLTELDEAAAGRGRGRRPQERARAHPGGGEVPGRVRSRRRGALRRRRRGRRPHRRGGPGPRGAGAAGPRPGPA